MIKKSLKKRIKKIMPHYINATREVLLERGITNRFGNDFSDTYISYVFNGQRHNVDIVSAILEAYGRKLRELDRVKKQIDKL